MFVLDSSGSIGSLNYNKVRNFTSDFVDNFEEIGPEGTQVGVIVFSSYLQIIFNLSTYSSKDELLSAIDMIPYYGQGTNTADALYLLINEAFTEEAGARLDDSTVFRLAIVMHD